MYWFIFLVFFYGNNEKLHIIVSSICSYSIHKIVRLLQHLQNANLLTLPSTPEKYGNRRLIDLNCSKSLHFVRLIGYIFSILLKYS